MKMSCKNRQGLSWIKFHSKAKRHTLTNVEDYPRPELKIINLSRNKSGYKAVRLQDSPIYKNRKKG